jgi:Transposase domain (DUF772)
MLAVSDAFFQSKSLTYAAAAIALLVAALLLLIFRRVFRRRLRVPETGNAGRLGIVKTFALDQSRQLVVVRRDHVEHLVMIGGPNDLVVESDIPEMMFKILVIQTTNNLSDERINDRLSFMRFLGLGLSDRVPDARGLIAEHLMVIMRNAQRVCVSAQVSKFKQLSVYKKRTASVL